MLKRNAIKNIFLICITIIAFAVPKTVFSQADLIVINGLVKDEKTNKLLAGVAISKIRNGELVETVTTGVNGRFIMNLEFDNNYDIKFDKSGYIGKFINIDATAVPDENKVGGIGFDLNMNLFEEVEGVNFDILKQPVGKAKYDAESGDIGFDYEYTRSMLSKIAALRRALEKKYKEEEEKLLADQKAAEAAAKKQAKFDALVQEGDGLMTSANYMNAIFKYSEALDLIPDVASVIQKLEKAKKALEDKQANEELTEKYQSLIVAADKLFLNADYEAAKVKYTEASNVKTDESYPKNRLAEIDKLLSELANKEAIEKEYKAAISAGDLAFKSQKFEESISSYKKALDIKKDEKYPADQIKLAEKNIADLAAEKEKEANYNKAIAAADIDFNAGKYQDAIGNYNKALTIKPSEAYPKDKIAEANKAIADAEAKNALDKQYNDAIAAADKLFGSEKWTEAKAGYTKALALKQEQYPKDQIAKVDAKLAEIEAKAEADKSYNDAITAADKLFNEKQFKSAIGKYESASSIKPAEEYPKDQIAKAQAELKALAEADALNKKYSDLIAKADGEFGKGSFQNAIATYNQALTVKAKEAYPKEQISKAEAELKKLASEAEKRKEYDAKIAEADASFGAKTYAAAIKLYNQALVLYPNETYPKDKIAEANKAIADAEAKNALDKQYNDAIAAADKLFGSEKWTEAKAGYTKALALKQEQYPKDQIAKVDAKLAEIEAKAEADKSYNDAITAADKLFNEKQFKSAIGKYESASSIKPAEEYPKDQIAKAQAELKALAEADALNKKYSDLIAKADGEFGKGSFQNAIATYNQALTVKAKEAYPKEQISKAEAELKKLASEAEKRKEYDAKIAEADASFGTKSYTDAIKLYNQALVLYPSEAYPKDKIAEANKAIAALTEAQENQKNYASEIKVADGLLKKKSYKEAIASYQKATSILPDETYPKEKINEAQSALNALADQAELNKNYAAKITEADALFAQSKWVEAKSIYKEASGLKPMEEYPVEQIAKIDAQLKAEAEANAINEQYNNLIVAADDLLKEKKYEESISRYNDALQVKPKETYPKEQIAIAQKGIKASSDAKALKAKYDAAIAEGDVFFGQSNYGSALSAYQNAKALMPNETLAIEKIDATNKKIAEQAELAAKQKEYQELIAKADATFASAKWKESIVEYKSALAVLPNETYPTRKIKEAEANIAQAESDKQKVNEAYDAAIKYADEQFGKEEYVSAITAYENSLNYKPQEVYPKDQIKAANQKLAEQEAAEAKRRAAELLAQSTEVPKEEKKETKVVSFTDITGFGDSDELKEKAQKEARNDQAEEKPKENLPKVPITTTPPEDLDGYRKLLGENYPEGVTKETIKEGNKTFYRTVIVKNKMGDEYLKVDARFGVFFFKNGLTIKSSEYNDGLPN